MTLWRKHQEKIATLVWEIFPEEVMSEQTPKRWEGITERSRKDAPGGEKASLEDASGVTVSKVWASVQGGVEERLSKVVKGHVLNFCERSKGERREFRFMMKSLLCVFLKFCISCCLPWQGYHHVTRRKREPSFSFFLFFFFNTTL